MYAKSGVGLFDLINNRNQQSDLFQIGQSENAYKLMSVIDSITPVKQVRIKIVMYKIAEEIDIEVEIKLEEKL